MKRTDYTKPTMKVVELNHRMELLVGSKSKVTAKRAGYGPANEGVTGVNSGEEWEWDD